MQLNYQDLIMKHTCFIIVTLIVLKSILDMTESFVCKPPSVYHNHTRTCVRLVQEKRAHAKARNLCKDSFKGDLVFIYDSETSSFIKEKLRTWNIEEALIGLQDAALSEQYRWGDNKENATYYDWATPSYVEDKTKNAVVATTGGWRKHNYYTPADFICQSATAVLPEVVLSCPIAEEGKQNHSLWCSVETYEVTQDATIQFCTNNRKNMCPTNGYTTSNQTVGSNIITHLNISSVRRKDEGTWTCFISFTVSSGTHHMNKSCDLLVYSIPQIPTCQHISNDRHVLVTCYTSKVYPEARCLWEATFDIDKIEILPESTQHKTYTLNEYVYYNTTCTASFRPNVTGVFKIEVTMYANQSTQGVTQKHNVTIGSPVCPSQFDVKLINNDSVIISWTPGQNGGLTQTFVFYSHTNTSLDRTLVATVVEDNNKSMVYTVKNLNINTSLVFSVDVTNKLSTTVCPDLNVSVNVSAPDVLDNNIPEKLNRSVTEPSFMLYLVMASLGVVLLAALLAVVVVRFRRQHSYNRKTCKHKKRKAEMEVLNNLYGLQDIKLYCNNT